ncbi:MAG: translation initiation factor IF-3 [Planctomycetes bacterium]|nr:translation initiation factor IF-3 [Planctomycetota bacterium]MCW8136246.1 translation initiation factor IF-3 [Planctomycetota bacterium]
MRPKRPPPPSNLRSGPQQEHRINRRIRIPRVQLIDHEGNNRGELPTEEALKLAEEAGLDLVEVSPTARPPVCKIMNYGQYKYSLKKRAKGNKAHQAKVKGVRLHPNTAEHDVQVAMKKCTGFLDRGDKVLIQVWFKGREIAHSERGDEILRRFIEALKDISKVESPIRREGKRMHLLLTPLTAEERNARKKQAEREKEKALEQKIQQAKDEAARKAEAEKAQQGSQS